MKCLGKMFCYGTSPLKGEPKLAGTRVTLYSSRSEPELRLFSHALLCCNLPSAVTWNSELLQRRSSFWPQHQRDCHQSSACCHFSNVSCAHTREATFVRVNFFSPIIVYSLFVLCLLLALTAWQYVMCPSARIAVSGHCDSVRPLAICC